MTQNRLSITDFYDLEAPYVTEYRRLLYRLLNDSSPSELKSIMITSAMVAEGKSTVCSFLAITAAMKKGLKTLIVDCDLRRPAIHHLFGLSSEPGLVEILRDGFNPKEAINPIKSAVGIIDRLHAVIKKLKSHEKYILNLSKREQKIEKMEKEGK